MRAITSIVIHCSATETGTLESIRRYHIQERGWQDIGYHYVIEKSGATKVGRGVEKVGAHCPEVNRSSIGICLVGDKKFSNEQFKSLKELVSGIRKTFGKIPVYPHKHFRSAKLQGKTCPNFDVGSVLDD